MIETPVQAGTSIVEGMLKFAEAARVQIKPVLRRKYHKGPSRNIIARASVGAPTDD
jgi:hypothetical protein